MKTKKFLVLLCLMILLVLSLSMVNANENTSNIHTNDVEKISQENHVNSNIDKTSTNNYKDKEIVNDNINSSISKKTSSNVKEADYDYDEDEEYGFNEGTYVELSYDKIKTNQYNISAEIYNSYGNPVKEGEITVYFEMGYNKYPTKTIFFKNGKASFIQKFHTNGRVKIYSKDIHRVSYQSKITDTDSQVSTTKIYRNKVTVKSNTLTFKVYPAEVYTSVPETCDVDEKVSVNAYAYDDEVNADKGKVFIYLDDKLAASKKVVNGSANFNLKINKTGKHIIETDFKTDYGETFYDTNVVEITRKKENITLKLPKYGYTKEEIVITTIVLNDTDKINRGYVLLKNNGKQFAKVKVKNSETTSIYRLPYLSDIYKLTAEYTNNNKKLASDSKDIIVYDSETLKYEPIQTATTDAKVIFKASVINPHITVNYGAIHVYLDDKLILNKIVKNGKVSQTIKMPNKSGTYNLMVRYVKQGYVIDEHSNKIKITDSEKIVYTIPKRLLPDNKYTFKVKVTSPNKKVNNGQIKYKIGSKTMTAKVKNGTATINYQTITKEKNLTATITYLKYNKLVDKKTSKVEFYYPYISYVYTPSDTIKGSKIKITASVYDKKYKDANSGKVVFYIKNKKIGTVKVKKGEAVLYYKTNLKAGIYKVTATYYDKNNKKVAAEDYGYVTVVNKLATDKNIKIKTLTPTSEYSESNEKSIGSSEYLNANYRWNGENYDEFISLTNSYWYYPKYNRLVKARYYYYSNGKTITKTYGEADIFALYRFTTQNENAPYKVEIAYRKMNAREKNFMNAYFGIKY